jgi:hypothetical protein
LCSWSYISWIYNYLCNQWLSPLKLQFRIPLMTRCTRCNIMWSIFQRLTAGRWFSPYTTISSTSKPDRHYIAGILLKMLKSSLFKTLKYEKDWWQIQHYLTEFVDIDFIQGRNPPIYRRSRGNIITYIISSEPPLR